MLSRRRVLGWTAMLGAAAVLPFKALANMVRPQAAFEATALDDVFAALGQTPEVHDAIQFSTPDIAENGAVVPIRIEVDADAFMDAHWRDFPAIGPVPLWVVKDGA